MLKDENEMEIINLDLIGWSEKHFFYWNFFSDSLFFILRRKCIVQLYEILKFFPE